MSDDERAHARIEAELAKLGAELSPPAGWQARVLAEVTAGAPSPWRRWWRFALPAVAAAVAIVVVLWAIRPPAATEVALAYDVDRSGRVVRSDAAVVVGDAVTVTAAGDAKHRAVWIYREERRLVLACPGAAGCSSKDDAVIATVKIELSGTYTLVVLTSREPLPVPTDSFDASLAAAERAGAKARREQLLVP